MVVITHQNVEGIMRKNKIKMGKNKCLPEPHIRLLGLLPVCRRVLFRA